MTNAHLVLLGTLTTVLASVLYRGRSILVLDVLVDIILFLIPSMSVCARRVLIMIVRVQATIIMRQE